MDDFNAPCCSKIANDGDKIIAKVQFGEEVHLSTLDRGRSATVWLSRADAVRLRDWLIAAHPLAVEAPKAPVGHTPTLADYKALEGRVRALGDLWASASLTIASLKDRLATMESVDDPLNQRVNNLSDRVSGLERWRRSA